MSFIFYSKVRDVETELTKSNINNVAFWEYFFTHQHDENILEGFWSDVWGNTKKGAKFGGQIGAMMGNLPGAGAGGVAGSLGHAISKKTGDDETDKDNMFRRITKGGTIGALTSPTGWIGGAAGAGLGGMIGATAGALDNIGSRFGWKEKPRIDTTTIFNTAHAVKELKTSYKDNPKVITNLDKIITYLQQLGQKARE